jgi:hypothetical protein
MPCYRIQYSKSQTNTWESDVLRCVSSCVYHSSGAYYKNGPWLECDDLGWDKNTAWVLAGAVTSVGACTPACTGNTPTNFSGGGSNVTTNAPHDCINGGCVPKTAYNTPGFYANLAACQSGCAKNSNCKGECVESAEIAALTQAANQLQARICK